MCGAIEGGLSLDGVNVAVVVGNDPVANLAQLAAVKGEALRLPDAGLALEPGQALVWMLTGRMKAPRRSWRDWGTGPPEG